MSTIKNDEIRLSGIATMSKPLDSTQYPSLSKIQDVIKIKQQKRMETKRNWKSLWTVGN